MKTLKFKIGDHVAFAMDANGSKNPFLIWKILENDVYLCGYVSDQLLPIEEKHLELIKRPKLTKSRNVSFLSEMQTVSNGEYTKLVK